MHQLSAQKNNSLFSLNNHFVIKQWRGLSDDHEKFLSLHAASSYEIIYLRTGTGKLVVNLEQNELNADKIFIIYPGQLRKIDEGTGITGFYISVSPDFFQRCDNQFTFMSLLQRCRGLGNAMVVEVDNTSRNNIDEIMARMKDEICTEHVLQPEILQALFKTFLLYISKGNTISWETDNRTNDSRIVQLFIELVGRHFIQKKMVADYASELCVTRSYLNKVVKKVSGFTASQIIQQFVIQEAKKQAIRSDNSMKQIAYSLGFDDSSHFSKFFKTNSGINFTHYKKEIIAFQ